MDLTKWERKTAKILGRSWEASRDVWLNYVPAVAQPGTAPEDAVADLPTVQAACRQAVDEHPLSVDTDILGLRNGVLAEAMFVLHKAAHVLGSAQAHVAGGFCSWSLSSAYQAAFFGMKAIRQFMGITVIETGNQPYLVDVWHVPEKKAKKKGLLGPTYSTLIQRVGRVEHRHLWACFQRLLRVCSARASVWPAGCVDSLRSLDVNAFARQRNDLHYTMTMWPLSDLHACAVIADFGQYPNGLDDGQAVSDPAGRDFSVALGLVIVGMGCQMIRDLADLSAIVRQEWGLLQGWLFECGCNHLYQAAFQEDHTLPHSSGYRI